MISRFHFHDGQCDFRQRWAQTDKWKAETQAGKGLFGAYRNPLTDDDSVKGMIRSTANTNAWLYAGKLWAMKEDQPALVMDPATMETDRVREVRRQDDRADLHRAPEDRSRRPATWSRSATPRAACAPTMSAITRSAPTGELVREKWFKVAVLLHDARLRDHPDYLVLHIVPSIGSWERLEQMKPALRLRHLAARSTPDHPAARRHEARGHPLVQARQLLRQPRAQRLAGRGRKIHSSCPRRRTTCSRSSPT
jgi:carotenoid cleavage dioxygenase